jgi:integrase
MPGSYQNGSDGLLHNWVLSRFGSTPIREIRQAEVIAWIGDMTTGKLRRTPTSKPLSASNVAQARLVLSGCLELAVGLGVVASNQANTKLVRQALPRVVSKTIKSSNVPSEWEVAVMVSVLAPSRWPLLVEVFAYGALRLGEGFAVKPGNVSDRGLDLTHAVGTRAVAEGGGLVLKTLKGYDERFVPLPPDFLDRLSDYASKLGADDLLFPGDEGGLMWASTFQHTVWGTSDR